MDGNGRWAARRNMDRLKGHYAGVKTFKQIVKASLDLQVKYLTVFAFSTENWKRSAGEVTGLMTLFRRHIRSEAAELFEHGIRVRFIGQRGRLDARLVALMEGLEAQTAGNTRMHLTVAVDYGGRDEIVRTARELAVQVRDGVRCVPRILTRRCSPIIWTRRACLTLIWCCGLRANAGLPISYRGSQFTRNMCLMRRIGQIIQSSNSAIWCINFTAGNGGLVPWLRGIRAV